mmetsp:Transcript_144180/g.365970  ORF Transcript_144180/g.365970 Transcript_144180/m.365970 type:complete len:215 (-) Transcript_144180:939-1583(-)
MSVLKSLPLRGICTAPTSRHAGPSSPSRNPRSIKAILPSTPAMIARSPPSLRIMAAAGCAPEARPGTGGIDKGEQETLPVVMLCVGQLATLPEPVTMMKLELPHVMLRAMPSSSNPSRAKVAATPAACPAAVPEGTSAPKPLDVSAATKPPSECGAQASMSGSSITGHCTGNGTTGRGATSGTAAAPRRRWPPLSIQSWLPSCATGLHLGSFWP